MAADLEPPPSPWSEAQQGWVLDGAALVARLRDRVRGDPPCERRRESRLVQGIDLRRVCAVVCAPYGVDAAALGRRGSRHEARAALADLARGHTVATHAELVPVLGLSRPESVPNRTRRFAARLASRWTCASGRVAGAATARTCPGRGTDSG